MTTTLRRRSTDAAAALLILILYTAGPAHAGRRFVHVRTLDAVGADVLASGYGRSPTFRHLVDAIEASDLIVYIERRPLATHAAFMQFVTRAGGHRYVRITLDDDMSSMAAIALLGHELQHAAEIARAAWVVDLATYLKLYRAIGYASCDAPHRCFDTLEAVAAGRQVLRDLGNGRSAATD